MSHLVVILYPHKIGWAASAMKLTEALDNGWKIVRVDCAHDALVYILSKEG